MRDVICLITIHIPIIIWPIQIATTSYRIIWLDLYYSSGHILLGKDDLCTWRYVYWSNPCFIIGCEYFISSNLCICNVINLTQGTFSRTYTSHPVLEEKVLVRLYGKLVSRYTYILECRILLFPDVIFILLYDVKNTYFILIHSRQG